jgi:hypothetical protein
MEEYNKSAWHELIERVEESGVVTFHTLVFSAYLIKVMILKFY